MIDRVATGGVVEIFEEFLDVLGFVAGQSSDPDGVDEFVKWRIPHIIPAEVALLQIGKGPAAICISGAL
jgi:hypothetical protein